MREPLWRRLSTSWIFLLGSVPVPELRATHVSREPARYPSLLTIGIRQALPHGFSWPRFPVDLIGCERDSRLAYLCRFCACVDRRRPAHVLQRVFGFRFRRHSLRARLHHHRPLPVCISVGSFSVLQRRGEDAHTFGSSRL